MAAANRSTNEVSCAARTGECVWVLFPPNLLTKGFFVLPWAAAVGWGAMTKSQADCRSF